MDFLSEGGINIVAGKVSGRGIGPPGMKIVKPQFDDLGSTMTDQVMFVRTLRYLRFRRRS